MEYIIECRVCHISEQICIQILASNFIMRVYRSTSEEIGKQTYETCKIVLYFVVLDSFRYQNPI